MPAKKGRRWRFSGFTRTRIAPTCATASVRIDGGSTGRPFDRCQRYRSLSDTFLMPTIRLSTSSSMIRSTSRNGYRCGRIRSIAALSSGSVRSMGKNRLYFADAAHTNSHRRAGGVPRGSVNEPAAQASAPASNFRDLVVTLFELGREITSVLNVDELLPKIPLLIARITKFQAFAVYLLDPRREGLSIAYSVGYPDDVARTLRVKVGHGLVGAAVAEGKPIMVNDVRTDPRYVEAVAGSLAELVVPLRRKGRVIGALNLLSDVTGQFTETDEALLRQFGAHVAVAIENARLFEDAREYTSTLETLAEIGREFGAILQLDELLTRIANLTKHLIDYRTFGILLINDETN